MKDKHFYGGLTAAVLAVLGIPIWLTVRDARLGEPVYQDYQYRYISPAHQSTFWNFPGKPQHGFNTVYTPERYFVKSLNTYENGETRMKDIQMTLREWETLTHLEIR